jgi:hypothetical protein
MTEEKVRKGEELLKRLSYLKDQKQRWEKGEKFLHPEVCTIGEYGKVQSSMSIDDSFINFDEIKLLAVAKINKRINEVQKEFDEL